MYFSGIYHLFKLFSLNEDGSHNGKLIINKCFTKIFRHLALKAGYYFLALYLTCYLYSLHLDKLLVIHHMLEYAHTT